MTPLQGVRVETRQIGPDEAEALLANHPKNRHLNEARVANLARMMTLGLWHFDGAPIRLGLDGRLLDGQHRLTAVIRSGTTQTFVVISGIEDEAQMVMDTGKSRSLADFISMRGESYASEIAALLPSYTHWTSGMRGRSVFSAASRSIEEYMTTFDASPQEFRDAATVSSSVTGRMKIRVPKRALGLAFLLMARIDVTDLGWFIDRLVDGAGLEADSAILALREKLQRMTLEDKTHGTTADAALVLALVIKAWNAYRAGDPVKVLNYRPGGAMPEKYPEPK